MKYNLEALGPERFQQLCQALLVQDYPNTQCFPVSQPDGGRDAIQRHLHSSVNGTFAVFQVKFRRNPFSDDDPHKWLVSIMQEEGPKLQELVPKGATAFYLLTNIPGTAHLEVGSIDLLDQVLQQYSPVPAMCLWRDDLERRLDRSHNLKWAFLDAMTGADVVRYLLEGGLSEHKERRAQAIQAYLRAQYDQDMDVRFKQVELQNGLLDLFVDVPVQVTDEQEISPNVDRRRAAMLSPYSGSHESTLGAAAMLLDPSIQAAYPILVIEGAPGQGKSTLAQFVCQVHRLHLLQRRAELARLSPDYHTAHVRVPFKVDLRDLATWLGGQDPFSSQETSVQPVRWQETLESFLAAQVQFFSGGVEFTVGDLLAVMSVSPVLLVLDGLDEVADIKRRQQLVSVVMQSVSRLQQTAPSLQVLITSRPAAFANSPGFPHNTYPPLSLASLSKQHIDQYCQRWLVAKRLTGKDAFQVKTILQQKLSLPHLKDLSRNTMQLAILLSLIHTKGVSLPDKRTAVYDNYVNIFFDRECEKNSTVRDNRDLLIDIHRYLAWYLHTDAEASSTRGNISSDRLISVLREYLRIEGRDTLLAERLFAGMLERVVFLVSRVEGTFEFEVQPLREYFAARYLNDTAPYSPPGSEKRGTKPDRFDAICRNFYWLNVSRFYAGCFSKGELPSLVDSLQALSEDQDFHLISYPYRLTAMLVVDYVFSQNTKSLYEATSLFTGALSRGMPVLDLSKEPDRLTFPAMAREHIVQTCWAILENFPPLDLAEEVIELLRLNQEGNEVAVRWKAILERTTPHGEITQWLTYGRYLGALSVLTLDDFKKCPPTIWTIDNLTTLLASDRSDLIEADACAAAVVVNGILDAEISGFTSSAQLLNLLAMSTSPWLLAKACDEESFIPSLLGPVANPEHLADESPLRYRCVESVCVFLENYRQGPQHWREFTAWNSVITAWQFIWGDTFAGFVMAVLAVNMVDDHVHQLTDCDLVDQSHLLTTRAACAKVHSSSSQWWGDQIQRSHHTEPIHHFVLLALCCLASTRTLLVLLPLVDEHLSQLTTNEWTVLVRAVQSTTAASRSEELDPTLENSALENLICSTRTIHLLSLRVLPLQAELLFDRYLIGYRGNDGATTIYWYTEALSYVEHGKTAWRETLSVIRSIYPAMPARRHAPWNATGIMPQEIARIIVKSPREYPRRLVFHANERLTNEAALHSTSIHQVSVSDEWFSDQAVPYKI